MRSTYGELEEEDMMGLISLRSFEKRVRMGRSAIHGWGAYAMEAIKPGEFVMEYCGELIRKPVGELREIRYNVMDMDSSYLFRIAEGHVVDATGKGHVARYINHSCQPNCEPYISEWSHKGSSW